MVEGARSLVTPKFVMGSNLTAAGGSGIVMGVLHRSVECTSAGKPQKHSQVVHRIGLGTGIIIRFGEKGFEIRVK